MDNLTNKQELTEGATAQENSEKAVQDLGKFKTVQALLDAYTNLEAEFTRRSQRLKELESANNRQVSPDTSATENVASQGEDIVEGANLLDAAMHDDEVKNAIIAEYLKRASENKGVPFITGGVNVSAQRRVPKSLKEAGALAQQYLNKKEN